MPSLDLRTRAVLDYWNAPVPRRTPDDVDRFWTRYPSLTLPQELARRLGRPFGHVPVATVQRYHEHRVRRGGCSADWLRVPLRAYERWFDRSHAAVAFRFDARQIARPLALGNPLLPLAAWATPDDILEDRLLVAGLSPCRDERVARTAVRQYLREGVAGGYVRIVARLTVTPTLWAPSPAWCRARQLVPVPLERHAPAHHALAVDAGLLLFDTTYSPEPVRGIRADRQLSQAQRAGRAIGTRGRVGATPDVELAGAFGRRGQYELLSRSYRPADVAEKLRELPGVTLIATSRTVALRVAAERGAGLVWYA